MQEIPLSAAGRNVLCVRHNNALEPLDRVGRRLLRALRTQLEHHGTNSPATTHVLLNGYDVERWILKVLCGLRHGQLASRIHPSSRWTVPPRWLEILFGGAPFPPGAGIYTPRVARGRMPGGVLTAVVTGQLRGAELAGVSGLVRPDAVTVLGVCMTIYGYDFELLMHPPQEPSQYWYRIRMLRSPSQAGGASHVHLGWPEAPPTFLGNMVPADRVNTRDDLLR